MSTGNKTIKKIVIVSQTTEKITDNTNGMDVLHATKNCTIINQNQI
jgi:hypothetical protein